MALDREQTFRSAERLLKQGKLQAALQEFRRLEQYGGGDTVVLNRIGDLLARLGRTPDALGYYHKTAQQFIQSGFLPKAAAIYKKILKLQPDHAPALVQLGNLYLQQELGGEARVYYLSAGEAFLKSQDFDKAREVYERLAAAEPHELRHRVRLAETAAASGDPVRAGNSLLDAADAYLASGDADSARKVYERARGLLGTRVEPVVGTGLCYAVLERLDDAVETLERELAGRSGEPWLTTALGVVYLLCGRTDDAADALDRSVTDDTLGVFLQRVLAHDLARGRHETTWKRVDGLLERWGSSGRAVALLEALTGLEENGHLPALERLSRLDNHWGDGDSGEVLTRLLESYRSRSMEAEAREVEARMRSRMSARADEDVRADDGAGDARDVPTASAADAGTEAWLDRAETPAVPLTPADREFVSGRLTEAEVLRKYGLSAEAVERLREITARFPGHVEAQSKLATALRAAKDRPALRETLVGLALARRADGDSQGAAESASEASKLGPLSPRIRSVLENLDLLESEAAPVDAAPVDAAPVEAPPVEAAPVEAPVPVPPVDVSAPREEEEIEIIFDDGAESEPVAADETPAAASPEAAPRAEDAAPARAAAAFDEESLEEIAAAIADATGPGEKAGTGEEDGEAEESAPPEGQESLDEIFQVFRRHVDEEVGSEDHRTRYDLGIAYKEMGMVEDAVREFEAASDSVEVGREARIMLAVCHRELGDSAKAADWYRKVIDSPGGTADEQQELRYELAETLLQGGNSEAALEVFRHVQEADPEFRDVGIRISEIQARLGIGGS